MAVTFAELTNGFSTSNPATSASISPTANRDIYIGVWGSTSTGPNNGTITITGAGITWTQIGSDVLFAGRRMLAVFHGKDASPSAGTLSITWTDDGGSGTFEQMKWSVIDTLSANATTPNGSVFTTSGTGTAATITISETPDSGDSVLAFFGLEDDNATTLNAELSTKLTDFGDSTGVRHVTTANENSPDSSPTPGITWTGSTGFGGAAFIVNAAAGAIEALAGSINASSTLVGALSRTRGFAGSVVAVGTLAGSMIADRALAGQIDGQSTLAGGIDRTRGLDGSIDGEGTLSAAMIRQLALSGQIDGVGTLAGVLSTEAIVSLAGSISGTGTLAGGLEMTRGLAGSMAGIGGLDGTLTALRGLAGTIDGQSVISGAITRTLALGGTIEGLSELLGVLSIQGEVSQREVLQFIAESTKILTWIAESTPELAFNAESTGVLEFDAE